MLGDGIFTMKPIPWCVEVKFKEKPFKKKKIRLFAFHKYRHKRLKVL